MPAARAARLMFQLPKQGRLFTKIQPANQWNWPEVLANKTNYLLEVIAWQKTKDAQKRHPQKAPKMFVPDFMINMEETRAINRGSEKRDIDDIKAILARPRSAA